MRNFLPKITQVKKIKAPKVIKPNLVKPNVKSSAPVPSSIVAHRTLRGIRK